jgi:hypothetical protein
MRAPSRETDTPDSAPAAPASLPFPSINTEAILEQTLEPEAVPEIAYRCALEDDRLFKNFRYSSMEPFQAPAAQFCDIRSGIKTGFVEDLVSIDIADAREHPLVEKEPLEPAATALETLDKSVSAELQRFRTEKTELPGSLRPGRTHGPDEPELADITKAEFPWRFPEAQNEMCMLIGR